MPPTTGGTGFQSRLISVVYACLPASPPSLVPGWRRQAFCPRVFGGRCVGASCPPAFGDTNHRYWNHAPSATLAVKRGGPLHRTQGRRHDHITLSPPVRHSGRSRHTRARRSGTHAGKHLRRTAGRRSARHHYAAALPAAHPPGRRRRWAAVAGQRPHAGAAAGTGAHRPRQCRADIST